MSTNAFLRAGLLAGAVSAALLAQQGPPPQNYPPPQGPPPQSYPPPQGYPSSQGYPPPQAYPPPGQQPPLMAPQQLDQLVERIALYPDPLLGQVLTASTFWNQVPDAAAWADRHSFLRGDELSRAIYEDNLPFDPS